jgi:hypothetical protein
MKRSVYFFGWATLIASALLVLSQLMNLVIAGSVDQVAGLLSGYSNLKSASLGPLMDMFTYNRIWSVYSIAYFSCTFVGAIQFLRFREIGRKILEIACWIGFFNACVDTAASYVFWTRMQSAMGTMAGGLGVTMAQISGYGAGAILAGFFLWVVPSIGIVVYLRRNSLKALMI